jgi:hypothetical protein
MFTLNMEESNKYKIEYQDENPEYFKILLDWFYTSKFYFNILKIKKKKKGKKIYKKK